MPQTVSEGMNTTIETLYRSESGRILATLVRLLGGLDVAEEAMHEAFAVALDTWPQTGVPDEPRPWLISTARFKAINGMRRRARTPSVVEALWPDGPDARNSPEPVSNISALLSFGTAIDQHVHRSRVPIALEAPLRIMSSLEREKIIDLGIGRSNLFR